MNRRVALAAGLAAAVVMAAGASAQDLKVDGDNLTVITSDRLTFDYQKQFALFEKNVVVVDPEMRLYADRMTVRFGADNRAQEIKAEGRVHIIQADKESRSELAIYNLVQGVIILTGKPQVTRGKDILTGDKITFWRDQNRMIVEPRARLILQSDAGDGRPSIKGEALRGR
jgi:lipopolysaccharide export system protein LptA